MTGYIGIAENFADAPPRGVAPATFAELYKNHYAAVYRAAFRITGNHADAEDALQTVFLRMLGTLSQGGDYSYTLNAEVWFRCAACNAAIDILRRKAARAEIPMSEVSTQDAGLQPVNVPDTTLLKEQLRRAIAALSPEDAELFLMRYVEGFSNGELAEFFRQEKNNIAVRLHRIRQTLQIEMK